MIQLRTYVLVFLLSIGVGTTTACSMWDMIKPSSPGLSVDTELVVGDKEQQVNTDIGHTTNTAETISIQNVDESPSFLFMFLMVLGWIMPDPARIWGWMKNIFKRRR